MSYHDRGGSRGRRRRRGRDVVRQQTTGTQQQGTQQQGTQQTTGTQQQGTQQQGTQQQGTQQQGTQQQGTQDSREFNESEPQPIRPPVGYNPAFGNFRIGALSPEGQWSWNGYIWNQIEKDEQTLLTDSEEESDTDTQVNYATVELLKESQEVEFTDSSNGATDVLWEFGDGNTSEERNPIHTYTENGTFTVTFTGYNQFGESSTTQTVIVEGIGTETYLHEYEVED